MKIILNAYVVNISTYMYICRKRGVAMAVGRTEAMASGRQPFIIICIKICKSLEKVANSKL